MRKKPTAVVIWLIMVSLLISGMVDYRLNSSIVSAETTETNEELTEEMSAEDAAQEKDNEAAVTSTVAAIGSPADLPPGMELITENEHLALYFHNETTEIAVKDKANQTVWYSNPVLRDEEKLATPFNKARLGSQLKITYYNSAGQAMEYDNFNDSIAHQQFEVIKMDDGVKIVYTLGVVSISIDSVPIKISEERMNHLIIDKLTDEKVIKDVIKKFKLIKEENVYERRDAALTNVALARLLKIFDEVGYTPEDVAFDNEQNNVGGATIDESATFTIPLEYRLDGHNLVAVVPSKEIEQPTLFPLNSITVLENFGAADQTKEGYMLVPDGSGSLIYLNNDNTFYDPFITAVYGFDNARDKESKRQYDQVTRLPVFGMKQDDTAFFTIIEGGDAIANVEADISGRLNSYNRVYSSFITRIRDEITLSGGWRSNTISIFQAEPFQGDITLRYGFMKGESANYAGMAKYYQDYLIEEHKLSRLPEAENTPFFLELTGSIPTRKTFLGIPYTSPEPLTTFSQAEEMIGELKDNGIDNIKLRYIGWFNEGVRHKLPTKVSPDGELGGKKGFIGLAEYLKKNKVDFYPDAAFMQVFHNMLGFSPSRDASRFSNRKAAKIYPFNAASYLKDITKFSSYVLSPHKLPTYVEKFIKSYEPYGIDGLSLRDMGNELNADYREDRVINRQESKDIVVQQIAGLQQSFPDLLVVGGNALALPYTKNIVNLPLSSSDYYITDESIPFYQMVIHGFIDYTGEPMNLSADQSMNSHLLKALETGSNVHFSWIYNHSSAVKDSQFNHLYSADYKVWLAQAKAMYDEVNTVLKDVRNVRIIAHEKLAKDVYRTVYEGGKTITVNYNHEAVNVNGMMIGPQSYIVGGDQN